MPTLEPFTVRLPAGLVAAVGTRASAAGGTAEMIEQVLRPFLATAQAGQERAVLLTEMEGPGWIDCATSPTRPTLTRVPRFSCQRRR